jgi:hypothetical protein
MGASLLCIPEQSRDIHLDLPTAFSDSPDPPHLHSLPSRLIVNDRLEYVISFLPWKLDWNGVNLSVDPFWAAIDRTMQM